MANQYKQMIGRAGRAGLSDYGESFLLFKSIEKKKVYDLISLPMKRCESSVIYLPNIYQILHIFTLTDSECAHI